MVLYDNIDEAVITIQKWVNEHKTLPKIETIILKHFVNVTKGNLQETQKLIESHYNIRASYPYLFFERDPLGKGEQTISVASDVIYLPKLTSDNYVIQISRVADPDPDKYLFTESVKATVMVYDILFRTMPQTQIIDGLISIFDSKSFTLKHLSKMNFSALRGFMKFFEKTTAYKVCQIHVINCPSYMNKIMAIMRPFMSAHINKMINFHEPNSETLYNYVSKDLLPIEIGGTGESLEILKKKQNEDLQLYRDYLMDSSYWKLKDNSASKVEKNFRSLNLD